MIFGSRDFIKSPVKQSFVYVAEYYDGTHLAEYDFKTKKHNSFYSINRSKLTKFGLIGEGSQIYFDVGNGVFNINNHRLMISYVANDIEYPLTGRAFLYNDIITYKDAVSDSNLTGSKEGAFTDMITQYNVGYKKKMQLLDIDINFQCILSIPYNDASFLQVKITSDKDLDGKLVVRRNGKIVDEIYAPLKANMSGNIHWVIR